MLEKLDLKPNGYKLVPFPEPGEFVVLHNWMESRTRSGSKEQTLIRAIAVGREPWGARGARSGNCIAGGGRLVAHTKQLDDEPFDLLFLDLLADAVHKNPSDSEIVSCAGEVALSIKQHRTGRMKIACPTCLGLAPNVSGAFRRGTKVQWYVQSQSFAYGPTKFANSLCVSCLKKFKAKCELAVADMKKPYEEKNMDGLIESIANRLSESPHVHPVTFLPPDAYTPVLEAVEALIDEI